MAQFIKKFNGLNNPVNITPNNNPSVPITGNFIMPPNNYNYNEYKYDLNVEGLYYIFNANVDGGYRQIYLNNIHILLCSLAQMCIYGRSDETLTNAQLLSTIKTRKVALRCGRTIDFVSYILNSVGVVNRKVSLLTAETPNNYDDGHVIIEVKINNVWQVYDIPLDFYWNSNLDERFNATYIKEQIAYHASDNTPWGSYQFASDVFYDSCLSTETLIDTWISRIYQIPGIWDTDGLCYFYLPVGTESRASWVLSLSSAHRILSYNDWKLRFYA